MSNLKPGCKAIVTGGQVDLGKIVKVGNFIGRTVDDPYDDIWEVDKPMSYTHGKKYYCPEHMLQRIDDHDQPETIKTEKEVTA